MANQLTEVEKLRQQIDDLLSKETDLINKEKASVIADIEKKMRIYGITPKDFSFGNVRRGNTAKVATKYKKGTNHWSGRGRKPKWVEEHITKGGKIEELLVK